MRHQTWKGGYRALLAATAMLCGATGLQAKEFVVKLKPGAADFIQPASFAKSFNAQYVDQHQQGDLLLIDIPEADDWSLAQQLVNLRNSDQVEYVVENIKMQMFDTPNDPKFSEQWALERVRAEAAWEATPGSREVIVAVIDTGVDFNHEDLKDNIWTNTDEIAGNNIDDDGNGFIDDVHGWDFRDNDANPDDETSDRNPGHGTHCAGIVGAVGNNGKGISGMSQQVTIMPVRFLGADGSGDLMNGAKGIDYAVENGAHIISASWGAAVPRSAVEPILEAIERARAKGVVFVAAAANDGANNDTREVYPANGGLPNMISVAASQSDDTKPSWSNFGKMTVDLASPGHEILSTLPKNKYGKLSGTSMATPLVSGLVALMMSNRTDDQPFDGAIARSLLQTTGKAVEIETACNCRVDAEAVVGAIAANNLTVVPAAATIAPEGSLKLTAWGGQGPYKFAVENNSIAGVSPEGELKGLAEGETKVTVTDANGNTADSLTILVANKPEQSAECPLGDPMLCMMMCVIQPDLPWCSGMPELPTP